MSISLLCIKYILADYTTSLYFTWQYTTFWLKHIILEENDDCDALMAAEKTTPSTRRDRFPRFQSLPLTMLCGLPLSWIVAQKGTSAILQTKTGRGIVFGVILSLLDWGSFSSHLVLRLLTVPNNSPPISWGEHTDKGPRTSMHAFVRRSFSVMMKCNSTLLLAVWGKKYFKKKI